MMDPATIDALRVALVRARRVLLTGPVDPDGDSLGACLGLARGLRALAPAAIDVAGSPAYRYAWMPGADEMVPDHAIAGPYDVAVVMDGDRRRLAPAVERAYLSAGTQVIVDHHASTTPEGYHLCLLDPGAASTTEMVHALLQSWGCPVDAALASLLYTGLIFDTGGFRHSNTRPGTHRLAAELLETGIDHAGISVRVLVERRPAGLRMLARALEGVRYHADGAVALGAVSLADLAETGAETADLEGIVDALVYTTGVEVGCLAIEKDAARVKLSLRSRRWLDVAKLARALAAGGGGHPRAAGVSLSMSLPEALERLPEALEQAHAQGPKPTPGR